MRIWGKWLVLVALALSPLGAAELYLRHVGLGDPILYGVNHTYRYAPLPSQIKVRQGGSTVTIDGNGLRVVKDWGSATARRILFIGDSVTWGGTSVTDRDTFAHLTCEHVERDQGGDYVCGNAGVNGYGIANMAQRLRHLGGPPPDCVVAVILPGDALRGLTHASQYYYYTRKPPQPLPAVWEAAGFVTTRAAHLMTKADDREGDEPQSALREVAETALDGLYAELRARSVPAFVVYTPYEYEVRGAPPRFVDGVVRASLARSGFPLIDPTPELAAATTAGEALYLDGVHYTAAGHAVVSRTIARAIGARCAPPPSR